MSAGYKPGLNFQLNVFPRIWRGQGCRRLGGEGRAGRWALGAPWIAPSLSMVLKQVFLTAGDKGEDKVSAVFHFDATGGFTGFRTLHAYLMVLP